MSKLHKFLFILLTLSIEIVNAEILYTDGNTTKNSAVTINCSDGVPFTSGKSSPNPSIKFSCSSAPPNLRNAVWTAKGLPKNLVLSRQGVLSGKPNLNNTSNVTIEFDIFLHNRGNLICNGTIKIQVSPAPLPIISRPSLQIQPNQFERLLPSGRWDSPYVPEKINNGYKLQATGGTPFRPNSSYPNGYVWKLLTINRTASQVLPPGMTLNSQGVISGTPRWPKPPIPSVAQRYDLLIQTTDFLGKTATANCTLFVEPPRGPEIITDCQDLPQGLENDPYPLVRLKARLGRESYVWPKPANLPPGLSWSEKGYISGKPSTRGNYPIELKVVDRNGLFATKNCIITIRPAPELDCPIIPCARVGDSLAPVQLQARGGDRPYNYDAVNLPPSLTINKTTGIISGNFTGNGDLTYDATFFVTDAIGRSANKTCPIEVKSPLEIVTESPLPFGIKGYPYPGKTGSPHVRIVAKGGWPTYSLVRIRGIMPPNLAIDPATGQIIGTPTQVGTYKFTIRVFDSCKSPEKWIDKEFEITIYDPITVLPQPNPCLTVNRTFSLNMTVSGGAEAFVWNDLSSSPAIADAILSVPVAANTRIATIAGKPTTAGPQSFTFNVTSTPLGITETITVNYTIHPELKITSDCPPAEMVVSKQIAPFSLTAAGGKGAHSWSKNGTWPPGLDLVGGKIVGTPTWPPGTFNGAGNSTGVSYDLAYDVHDECNNRDSKKCLIKFFPEFSSNASASLPCFYEGQVLDPTLVISATGGVRDYFWAPVQSASGSFTGLPPGLIAQPLPDTTGLMISGKIEKSGNYTVPILVSDKINNILKNTLFLVIHPKLEISNDSVLPWGLSNTLYDPYQLKSKGGKPPIRWKLANSSELPDNLSLSQSGLLTGLPKKAGKYSFYAIAEDDCSQVAEIKQFFLTIYENIEQVGIVLKKPADPGNENDSTGFGKVNYNYQIGESEVTNAQYAEFLNAVATTSDPHGLYNDKMGTDEHGGIAKEEDDGPDKYLVKPGKTNHPVNFVSWFDVARFANWLHNGRSAGSASPGTTENGAYDLTSNPTEPVSRKSGALYFIPTENEWYKAAYYKGFISGGYWTYPTKSNIAPGKIPGAVPNNVNYNIDNLLYPKLLDVKSFILSDSPSGTFDQGGNVDEWLEDKFSSPDTSAVMRGGSFVSNQTLDISSIARYPLSPYTEDQDIGFRIGAPGKDDYPAFEFLGNWEFTDENALALGHNGSKRVYSSSNIPPGALWSVQDGGFGVRIDFEKSQNCKGNNSLTQTGTATLKIKTIVPQTIFVKWEGMGEMQAKNYDKMNISINNVLIGEANAPGGGLGCNYGKDGIGKDGAVTSKEYFPNGYLLSPGNHTIIVNSTTNDGLFHSESFYKFRFSTKK